MSANQTTAAPTRAAPVRDPGDRPAPRVPARPTAGRRHEPAVAHGEPVCATTLGGLGVLHVGGRARGRSGSSCTRRADAGAGGRAVRGVRAVDHRRLPPPVRPSHLPRRRPPVRWALLAFGAATFQNSALSWSADHRAHHADTDGAGDPHADHPWRLVRPRRLAVPSARGVGRRHAASPTCGRCAASGCSTASTPSIAIGVGLVAADGDRRGRGATRWAACSSPASCARRSCCRRRSASTRSPTSSARRATTRRSSARDSVAHRARHLRRGLPQLPPPLPVRLPQRRPLVAVRPEQVAHLAAGEGPRGRSRAHGVAGGGRPSDSGHRRRRRADLAGGPCQTSTRLQRSLNEMLS